MTAAGSGIRINEHEEQMSEPISVVVLSTGLENFKDIRKALTAEPRVKLLAGAREFLRIPISTEELRTVLDRISEFCTTKVETPKKQGRMVAVFSSKGGCGTSFIATNLAAATNSKTVLVDLNLQAGDLPLFLGLETKYSIADMVEKRQRL